MAYKSWNFKYKGKNIDINIPLVTGGSGVLERLELLDFSHQQAPYPSVDAMLRALGSVLPDYENATISFFDISNYHAIVESNLIYKKPFLYCGEFYDSTSWIESLNGKLEYIDTSNYLDLKYTTFPPSFDIKDSDNNIIRGTGNYYWIFNTETYRRNGADVGSVGFPIIEVWDYSDIYSNRNNMYWVNLFNGAFSNPQFDGLGIDFSNFALPMDNNALKYLTNGAQGETKRDEKEKNPYSNSQPKDDGGNGPTNFTRTSNSKKPLPPSFYSECGLLTVYIPTLAQLKDLSNYLWSPNGLDLNQFKKIQNNPFDLLLGLNYIPFPVEKTGTTGVNVGNILAVDTNLRMDYTTKENYEFSFGSVDITEEYNAFLDYAPHSRMTIHLPYIGAQPIDADMLRHGDFNPHKFSLKYKYNIVTGTVVAYLESDDGLIIQTWASNVATPIPLASNDFSNTINGLVGLATSSVLGGVTGGVMGAMTGGITGTASAMTSLKPTITHSGSIGSSASMLAPTDEAYIIIEQPQASVSDTYSHYRGFPRNTTGKISSSNNYGYNEIESVRLAVLNATENEKQEIENILKSGYIYGDADEGVHSKITLPTSNNVQFALYQTNSSNIRIDKTATLLHNYDNLVIKDKTSIINPTIILNASDTNVTRGNYAYIPRFNRFYYVQDVKSVAQDIWEIDLKCDVLMSFRDDIVDQTVIFKRSESAYNLYLNDDRLQIDNRTNIYNYIFPHKFNTVGTYVLLLAGNNTLQ